MNFCPSPWISESTILHPLAPLSKCSSDLLTGKVCVGTFKLIVHTVYSKIYTDSENTHPKLFSLPQSLSVFLALTGSIRYDHPVLLKKIELMHESKVSSKILTAIDSTFVNHVLNCQPVSIWLLGDGYTTIATINRTTSLIAKLVHIA